MTLLLRDADVRKACDIARLVWALDEGLRREAAGAGAQLPERINVGIGESFLRTMPALLPESGLMGLKFFHGSMRSGVRYVVALCSLATGEILALVDASYLTAARTGATSGVATHWLSRADSASVGVIGSGLEAQTNLESICAVRDIKAVRVYSRSAERREAFAGRMADELGCRVTAVTAPQDAVAGTDIVLVATNTGANGPVAYQGRWLESGQHVVSIGSTSSFLREIDEQTFLGSGTVVFDARANQVKRESGDVAALCAANPAWDEAISLDRVVRGAASARSSNEEITLFKSVGTAAQDLLAAGFVYQAARRLSIGEEIGEIASPKTF